MSSKKDKVASALGSILEWYDFSLYGFFAPLLASIYFPSSTPVVSLLKIFAVFAIGFFARPIGALLFGYISDKYGRILTLKITPWLITLSTCLLVFIPSYNEIGVTASVLVCFLRIAQGISIGGEYSNNMIYLCETANAKRTFFYGSIGSCSGSIGLLLASSVTTLCYVSFEHSFLIEWGWKIAFSSSIFIGILTGVMRNNLTETPVFKMYLKRKNIHSNPLLISIKKNKIDYLLAVGITFLPATAFYYVFMFIPNYLSQITGDDIGKTLGNNSISLFIRLFFIPFFGFIADKIGGIKMAGLSCLLFIICSIPLSVNIFSENRSLSSFSFYFMALLTTLNAATTPGLLVNLIRPEVRSTIFSLAFNVCFGVFGGITPFLSFFLIDKVGNYTVSVYYLIFSAFISLAAIFFTHQKRGVHERQLLTNC